MQDLYPLQKEKKIKKQRKGLGQTSNFVASQEANITQIIFCKFQKDCFELLILHRFFFMVLYMYIAPGQDHITPDD